ncbi:protocadherin alpha-8-like isoform X19 [Vanacampus margaritifer]
MTRCGMGGQWPVKWISLCLPLLIVFHPEGISAQIRYSMQEEVKPGTVIGNVAKDLGLEVGRLLDRNLRVVSGTKQEQFKVNQKDGVLSVHQRLDREDLCGNNLPCITNLKVIVENPLEMHQVFVEVLDVNDNSPKFLDDNCTLEVLESAVVGSKLQVEGAQDLDVGLNSVQMYKLNHNSFFQLETEDFGEEGKVPFLVLQRPLDRENAAEHHLILTAADGGKPPKTVTINITVIISDVNDNAPVCDHHKYSITVKENAPVGTYLLTVNASDSDEGLNGEIEYSLRNKLRGLTSMPFDLNKKSGALSVKGELDFEERQVYELKILAVDKGAVSLSTQCNVVVRVEDVNDNRPKIEITSLLSRIAEDAPLGTVVALVGVNDMDSGVNGQVVCSLPEDLPFALKSSPDGQSYSLVTKHYLDKEREHLYDITITAKDLGTPSMSSTKVINVDVLDVNDNRPLFSESPYTFYVLENNKAGVSLFSVSAADADGEKNAAVTYSLKRKSDSVTSFLSINEVTGTISALKSFDFETLKSFQFQVVATDGGSPPLSSNVTVNVFILDQNDNAPVILYPVSSNGSAEGVEEIPRNMKAGDLVTKVRAVDADIGYNGWLLFSLQQVTHHSLFSLDRYTGQIRTLRSLTETDEAEHGLLILVKDNGNVSLSATATVTVKLVEPKEAFAASDVKSAAKVDNEEDNVTFYLIITLGSVSLLFVISIIVLIAMQCSKSTEYTSKYLQDANYDGTLCHSIQYRSGDKRYMLVGPRMSIGSTIVPGSHANTLVLPDRRHTSGEPKGPNSDWRYSASLRAGGVMQSSVHMEESSVMQGAQGVLVQNWPTASSAADAEGGEVSPPMGAGVDSNSWHFRYGPGGPGAPPQHLKAGDVPPEAFIIPGSPAIISIRQNQGGDDDKSDFITFGKKEEAKKKKKKKKDKKDKKDKGKDDDE